MPELIIPRADLRESYLAAMAEFREEGRGGPEDTSATGHALRDWTGHWDSAEGFALYLATLRVQADPAAPQPAGRVPGTTWWWVDGPRFLGRIAVRHRLTRPLLENGGSIGYEVRRSARGQGHATAMLTAVLPHAHALGIGRALLICDAGNPASRRVIEKCGGVLEDERGGRRRYWVATGS